VGKRVARRDFLGKTNLEKGGFWHIEKKTFWLKWAVSAFALLSPNY
jgi:hypothetical protein